MARTETVSSSYAGKRRDDSGGNSGSGGGGGTGRLVNQVAQAAANTARGVFGQATGKKPAQVQAKRGGDRLANQAPMTSGRRETINPQYEAILKAQGYVPSANSGYAAPRPQAGNPGQANTPLLLSQGGGNYWDYSEPNFDPGPGAPWDPTLQNEPGGSPTQLDPTVLAYIQQYGQLPPWLQTGGNI